MAKKKVYDSDAVQVYPYSGGTTVDWLKEAGLGDTIEAAPVTDLGGGRYEAQDLPNGYSYVHYSGQANDPTETEATRGSWAVADNAWTSDEDWDAIQNYKAQYEQAKAAGDTAAMEAAHAAAEQIRSQYGYSGGVDGSGYLPTMAYTGVYGREEEDGGSGSGGYGGSSYLSKYQARIDALADAILNREAFSYNKDTDPLYLQYKESYTRGGQRGMQDTLAQVSARTGGMASSYAQSAAQQTYNNYMAQLANKVPELYQLAYSMYMDDLNQDRNDLSMLMGLDDAAYGRYTDQRDFDYGAYRDQVADSQWQQQFDYNAQQDALAQQNWQTQWDYQLEQDALDRALAAMGGSGGSSGGSGAGEVELTAWETIQGMRSEGEVADYLISQGYTDAEVERMLPYWRQVRYSKENNGVETPADDDYVSVPNYGKITFEQAERLEEQGAIVLVGMQNGKPVYSLPDDWNKNNKVFETTK